MLPTPEPGAVRRKAEEEVQEQGQEQEQEQEEEHKHEQENDFFSASNTFKALVLAKAKAVAKDETKCDIANVICALLFQIIPLIYHHDGEDSFKFVTPIYAAHIMLNVKRKSLVSSSSSSLSSPNNNRSHKNNNDDDDETNTFVKMAACASAVWTFIVWSIFNTNDGFMEVMSAVWITGSIFNLLFLTRDIRSLRASFAAAFHRVKPSFLTFSLLAGWVANILCLMAVVMGEFYYNGRVGYRTRFVRGEIPHVLLTIGLIVYIIHSILFGLSICFSHILFECFSDEHLRAVLRSRGRDEGEGLGLGEGKHNNNDDDDICRGLRKDDIIKVQCLFLMPVFILAGIGFDFDGSVAKGFMGGLFYLSYTILEMKRRKAINGGTSSDVTRIGMLGGIMLCIGSLFFCTYSYRRLSIHTVVYGIFWVIGCCCNLFVIIVTSSDLNLGKLRCLCRADGRARPIFKVLFVWTSLAANILHAVGVGLFIVFGDNAPGGVLLFFGFVLFFIQPFFLALSIICGHIVCSMHISTPVPGNSSGDQPGGVEEFAIPLLDKKNDASCDASESACTNVV